MCAFILVVEDDDDIADMMVRTLARVGHTLTRVDTGRDAEAAIAEDPPDLVLLDLGLPDIDGVEVCRRARAGGYTGGVVIATARTSPDDVEASLGAGADDFLTKPFGLAELRARVNDVLRHHARPSADVTTASGLTLRTATRRAHAGPIPLPLTDTEFNALARLAADAGDVVPTRTLVTSRALRCWSST